MLWSGSNDLLTVNTFPSSEIIAKSLAAKEQELTKLISNGYRNFCLITLPDPSLTPVYKDADSITKEFLSTEVAIYNKNLVAMLDRLKLTYPQITTSIFDAGKSFAEIVKSPASFGFDESIINVPMKDCPQKSKHSKETGCGKVHLFWDSAHPTSRAHTYLYKSFSQHFAENYRFVQTEDTPGMKARPS